MVTSYYSLNKITTGNYKKNNLKQYESYWVIQNLFLYLHKGILAFTGPCKPDLI